MKSNGGAPKIIFDNVAYPVDYGDIDILSANLVDKNGIRTYIFIARLDTLDFPVNWQWANTFVHFPDKSNCSEASQFGLGVSQKPKNLDVWINGNCFQSLKNFKRD
ncbi:MAG: hypothetical protein ACXVCP_10570 [Bdellovibrio sp.]